MVVEYFAQQLWRMMMGDFDSQVLSTLLVFVSVLLLVKIVQWFRYDSTLPPGPWGVPILGYLPFVKGPAHLHFNELAKKFGSIFRMRLGSELVVILSDYRVIRDSFRREEFTARPHTDFMNILDGYGIVNTEGDLWKDQRSFLQKKLRDFGMTKFGESQKNLEKRIMHEVQIFLKEATKWKGKPTNLSSSLAVSISNVICSLTMNVRFEHGDLKFKRFMDLIDEGFKLFARLTSANYISFMRYLPWTQSTRNKIAQNREEMANFFQGIIEEHKRTYTNGCIRDVVDAYLHEIRKAKDESREDQLFQGKDKDRQMQQILGDLFSAGMETVKNTLEWSVVFMLHYPEAARAVQDELYSVLGKSKIPSLDDIPSLPITNATILEVLRRSSLVPLGTPHATTRNTKVNGYTLPAGTHVIPLLYAVHMDPELWDEPEVFRPSRFLKDGKMGPQPHFFMPFGVGKRMCLGDLLARMELFLFFSSLMYKFDLSLPEGAPLPSLHGSVGVTISPEPFEVCLVERMDCNIGLLRNIGSH